MAPICPYCNSTAVLVNSTVVYGCDYGMLWLCSNWPECDAYVSCHRGTNKPKGGLACAELRRLRIQAHEHFDKLWQSGEVTRKDAYEWLKTAMGLIATDDAHIAKFDARQCKQLIGLLEIPKPYRLLSWDIKPPGERGWIEAEAIVSYGVAPRTFSGGALTPAGAMMNAIQSMSETAERKREERKEAAFNPEYQHDREAIEFYERDRE